MYRRNADKQQAVRIGIEAALQMDPRPTNVAIAKRCGVAEVTIRRAIDKLDISQIDNGEPSLPQAVYAMIAEIGASDEPEEDTEPEPDEPEEDFELSKEPEPPTTSGGTESHVWASQVGC